MVTWATALVVLTVESRIITLLIGRSDARPPAKAPPNRNSMMGRGYSRSFGSVFTND